MSDIDGAQLLKISKELFRSSGLYTIDSEPSLCHDESSEETDVENAAKRQSRKRRKSDYFDESEEQNSESDQQKNASNQARAKTDYYDSDDEEEENRARGYDCLSDDNTGSSDLEHSECQMCFCNQIEAIESNVRLERCKTCKKVYCSACGVVECAFCSATLCGECKLDWFKDHICFNCLNAIVQKNGYNLV